MIPMKEIQLFLHFLKGEYYEKATKVLDKLINTKHKASFVDGDSVKELVVEDVIKKEGDYYGRKHRVDDSR